MIGISFKSVCEFFLFYPMNFVFVGGGEKEEEEEEEEDSTARKITRTNQHKRISHSTW